MTEFDRSFFTLTFSPPVIVAQRLQVYQIVIMIDPGSAYLPILAIVPRKLVKKDFLSLGIVSAGS
jgi:hypothetical protein